MRVTSVRRLPGTAPGPCRRRRHDCSHLGRHLEAVLGSCEVRSGIVNVVGEHAIAHLALDAPLTSDIEGLARPMSHWVRTVGAAAKVAQDGREAVVQASSRPGRISTLVLPADMAWSTVGEAPQRLGAVHTPQAQPVEQEAVISATRALEHHGASTLLLLGGRAVRASCTEWAGRIAAATGCTVMSEFYAERIERGAGRVAVPRIPYSVQRAVEVLSRFEHIVLVCAAEPVAFFVYPDKPGRLAPAQAKFVTLATHSQDPVEALRMVCEELGATRIRPVTCKRLAPTAAHEEGPLTPASLGSLLATLIPDNAIVVDEAISTGRAFDMSTRDAAPHDWLTNMGGSIGFGLPVAVGAAIAAPQRRVIALEGDGSAMYTLQSLWTMARESLNVTVVVFANRSYQILRGEYAQVGAGDPGRRAADMLSIDRPALDWTALASGQGVPACRVSTLGQFADAMRRTQAAEGPGLIEIVM